MTPLRDVTLPERGPVHIATSGIDGSSRAVLRFFQLSYTYPEFEAFAADGLDQFQSIEPSDHAHLKAQLPVRYKGHFARLKAAGETSFRPLRKSLRTISQLPKRRAVPLAAAFVIGFRESGKNLIRSRGMKDTFWQSGLDHLHPLQGRMRRGGLLPKRLKFAKGRCFGDFNPDLAVCRKTYAKKLIPHPTDPKLCRTHVSVAVDKDCRIESANVPKDKVFLAHWASVGRAVQRFEELGRERGFGSPDFLAMSDAARFFWLSYAFARPGGHSLVAFRRRQREKRKRRFGSITLLDYFESEGLSLNEVVRIIEFAADLFLKPEKRLIHSGSIKIAIRTAATIWALDRMMHTYLRERVSALQIDSEFELIRKYLAV